MHRRASAVDAHYQRQFCLSDFVLVHLTSFLATIFQRKVACFVNSESDLHMRFDELCRFRPPVTFTGVWALIIEKQPFCRFHFCAEF